MAEAADVPEIDRLPHAVHPRETAVLVGHDAEEAAFLGAYRSGRFPHAWILSGDEGVGKATFAYRAARFVLAHPDPASPAVQQARDLSVPADDPAARRVLARSHPGLFVVRRAWNTTSKSFRTEILAEQSRDAVRFFATTAGGEGWRVCIVDAADDFNVQSANALLKVVEEPPQRALFLIVSHMPGRLLPTIRSRCRMLRFRSLDAGEVAPAAARALGLGPDEGAVHRAAALAGGSVRQACKLMDEGTLAIVEHIRGALGRLPAIDWTDIHAVAEGLAGRANDTAFEVAAETIFGWLSEQAHAAAGQGVPAGRLAPLAEVWDKVARAIRETDAYNLDRRALVLTLFHDLSDALRQTRAA
jgi:DNA polymerase-3 subunit delta'